jgi:hypothetical protein
MMKKIIEKEGDMQGEFLKGDVKDVCAELEAEAQRCKGMTVGEWLRLRRLERAVAEQFGMTEDEYRRELRGGATN